MSTFKVPFRIFIKILFHELWAHPLFCSWRCNYSIHYVTMFVSSTVGEVARSSLSTMKTLVLLACSVAML
ncbi:hypothetical protein [Rubritalea tangerina]|uniref:hypothetical protein n=1 Tax=Rubritalea tangerina TaxID=430798 RepID=UPI003607A9B2